MPDASSLPLYYEGQSLADMEAALRRDYLTKSGWLESAESKLAQRDGKPLPWFTYAAISFLEQAITRDQSVFEYGGGQSTLYWAARVHRVASVDHDPAFVAHIRAALPSNAEFTLIEENAPLSENLRDWVDKIPQLPDPERSVKTYRSGQLNQTFREYALKLLGFPTGMFDVVVVDGMARVLSAWAAIRYFRQKGFIVFDNADRDFYRPAYDLLSEAGYRRLDFWGLGPINPYEWCTAVFYQPSHFLGNRWFERKAIQSSAHQVGASDRLGILVLGFNRPYHFQAVLESLRLQGRIGDVHAWIDGTQARGEYLGANTKTVEIARRYALKEVRAHQNHLGIEKLMLDALDYMSEHYDRVLVLEDDCFPLEGAVEDFEAELKAIAGDPNIYSVYGHHFGTEPEDNRDFSRFQGWGWAAHSCQIRRLLPELWKLFLMDENSYLRHVANGSTPDVRAKLDRTPGRDVLGVLGSFFSWDSATAFLTAVRGLQHRRTQTRCVVNNGIVPGIGHFRKDEPHLRRPPFNMITLEETWAHFDQTTAACNHTRDSYGLDRLDRLIMEALPDAPGVFVEIGAYDGITQSNSVLLEAAGWHGLLIEATPGSYAKCVRARPRALVEHAACVAADFSEGYTTITDVGLMSVTTESIMAAADKEQWLSRGEGFAARPRQDIDVPAAPLSVLLDKHSISRIDLLLLDTQGSEIEVLKGLDFARHAPKFIVAEDAHDQAVADFLQARGYSLSRALAERKFTRDRFYIRN